MEKYISKINIDGEIYDIIDQSKPDISIILPAENWVGGRTIYSNNRK